MPAAAHQPPAWRAAEFATNLRITAFLLFLLASVSSLGCSRASRTVELPVRPAPDEHQVVVVEDAKRVRRHAIRSTPSGEWDWAMPGAVGKRKLRFEWAAASVTADSPVATSIVGTHRITVGAHSADGSLIRALGTTEAAGSVAGPASFQSAEIEVSPMPPGSILRFRLEPAGHFLVADVRLIPRKPGPAPVVLIVFDTVRADAVGIGGAVDPSSPNIDAIFRDGWKSSRAYAAASWTVPSMAAILTGRVPAVHEDADGAPLGIVPAVPTIAGDFRAAGWSTAAFVANPTLHAGNGFSGGFDTFFTTPYDLASISLPASATMQHVMPWLASHDGEPFFLWVHLMDPHDPYTPPDRPAGTTPFDPGYSGTLAGNEVHRLYLGQLPKPSERDIRHLQALYHDEVRFADEQIGRLWDALPDDTRRRATFVFTSDHGEELSDHGGWKHGPALWDEVIRVPLAIRPGAGRAMPAVAENRPVSLLDIVPTLESLTGLPRRARPLDGRDLLDPSSVDRQVLPPVTMLTGGPARASVIRGDSKLVFFDATNTRAYPDPVKDPEGASLARSLPSLLPPLGRFDLKNDREERTLLGVDAASFADDWRAIESAIAHTRKGIEVRLITPAGGQRSELVFEGVPGGTFVEPFALDAGETVSTHGDKLILSADATGDVDGFILRGDVPLERFTVTTRSGGACIELVTAERTRLSVGEATSIDLEAIPSSIPRLETTDARCAGLFVWRSSGRSPRRAPEQVDEDRRKLKAIGYLH